MTSQHDYHTVDGYDERHSATKIALGWRMVVAESEWTKRLSLSQRIAYQHTRSRSALVLAGLLQHLVAKAEQGAQVS